MFEGGLCEESALFSYSLPAKGTNCPYEIIILRPD